MQALGAQSLTNTCGRRGPAQPSQPAASRLRRRPQSLPQPRPSGLSPRAPLPGTTWRRSRIAASKIRDGFRRDSWFPGVAQLECFRSPGSCRVQRGGRWWLGRAGAEVRGHSVGRAGWRAPCMRSGAWFTGRAADSLRDAVRECCLDPRPRRALGLTRNRVPLQSHVQRGGVAGVPGGFQPLSQPSFSSVGGWPRSFPDRQKCSPPPLFHPTPVHPKAPPSGPEVRIYDASIG